MENNKVAKLSQNSAELQKEIRLEKDVLELLKEEIKEEYMVQKEECFALDEGFDYIKINGVILQERKNPTYTWLDDFYEEGINRGIVHMFLKHGDKLKERFNLEEYKLEKSIENRKLGYRPVKSADDELIMNKIEARKTEWETENIEQKVERYMRYKKLLDLKNDKYEAEKALLLNAMKETGIDKTEEGFYLKDELDQYDYTQLYNVELEETVVIATNGVKSVDLFHDKKIVEVDVTENDLYNAEIIKKRFGKKRLDELKEVLGGDFYFVKGHRIETDVLKRFPVSTKDVEDAIDKGLLPANILKEGRIIKSVDDLKLSFEIISEESAIRRAEINHAQFMQKALKRSGYYDSVKN